MKRLLHAFQYLAGGLLFVVMVLITASAIARYGFNRPLLDGDDLARLLLLPAIFFGLAGACERGEHIQVDLIRERLKARGRLLMDRFADFVAMLVIGAMAIASVPRVQDIFASHVGTYELRLPLWPFFALASLGLLVTTAVMVLRVVRLFRGEPVGQEEIRS